MSSKDPDAWHERLYDSLFAKATIGSKIRKTIAKKEITFLDAVLRLPKGATILDVPCGTGRHSIFLAKKGYRVVAIDINSDCLRIAKKTNVHKNIRYLLGNLKNLRKYRGRFDVVLNMSTSFGYFSSDKKNKSVLKQLISALKPGGKLVINTINRDYVLKHFDPARWWRVGKYLLIESRKYNPKTKYMASYFVFTLPHSHKAFVYYGRFRLYNHREIINLMRQCDLKKVRIYGDAGGHVFNRFTSSHPFYVGVK